MAIDPEFANLLLSGKKRVEFRRTRFASSVSHVVIYATNPVQRLVGAFEIDSIVIASPNQLWERFKAVGGISRSRFREYFRGKQEGVAIRVKTVEKFANPCPLSSLDSAIEPPQSFRYLPSRALPALRRLTSGATLEGVPT